MVKVEKIEAGDGTNVKAKDWLLTSLAAFETVETLTLELNGGDRVEIRVTDDVVPITAKSNLVYNGEAQELVTVNESIVDTSTILYK
ncbi:MAG: hypothetical protein IJH92_08620, partial [Mogibacterium sp.]|nr:hypothetical protein [Mogibacterium sp.]